jgi:uncharacterized coiled-coil DUF342 family protein
MDDFHKEREELHRKANDLSKSVKTLKNEVKQRDLQFDRIRKENYQLRERLRNQSIDYGASSIQRTMTPPSKVPQSAGRGTSVKNSS